MDNEQILRKICDAEVERGVRVPLAVECGSRCLGFDGKGSDHDVRFVYVRPRNGYLTLRDRRDTMEYMLTDELDVVGWDVVKFLRLMRGSNPTVFEWLGSSIVYREYECFEAVREVAPRCFNPVAHAHHYLGMATKHDMRYIRNNLTTPKRYIYAVRSLLACRWAIEERMPVPMPFDELKEAKLDAEMVPIVDGLVTIKRNGDGGDPCDHIPVLDRWVYAQEDELRAKISSLEATAKVDWDVLDEIFVDLVDFYER